MVHLRAMAMETTTTQDTKHTAEQRYKHGLILICSLVMIILWLLQVTQYLNVADDAGRYMVLGESLARTGDLRLINEVHRPLDTLYPPGFPLIIAACLKITGWPPGSVVIPVKVILLAMAILSLPFLYRLFERAQLGKAALTVGMLLYAACPAVIGYANEIMSDLPLLVFCVAGIALVEQHRPSRFALIGALICAFLSFYMRTSGIALLFSFSIWYSFKFGKKWGLAAWITLFLAVGLWLGRNHIVKVDHPKIVYTSYLNQFTLRDPMKMGAGRIPLNLWGLASRIKFGFPTYIGMIPRAYLYLMAPPHTWQLDLFYEVAVPWCLLSIAGMLLAWKKGMYLTVGFSIIFWLTAALWPWQNARFVFPLVPFEILFVMLSAEWLLYKIHSTSARITIGSFALGVTLFYIANVTARIDHQEQKPTVPGYAMGRSLPEAGFYAACAWLRTHTPRAALVMGKPAYLLHLYSGHPTTQIDPSNNARGQERASIEPQKVQYLVEDSWPFGFVTHKILAPYFKKYGNRWNLVWKDPRSGVKIWQRKPGTYPPGK